MNFIAEIEKTFIEYLMSETEKLIDPNRHKFTNKFNNLDDVISILCDYRIKDAETYQDEIDKLMDEIDTLKQELWEERSCKR